MLQIVMRPCNCWRFRVPREMRIKDIIAHIFDYHVIRKGNWTLDRLAELVQRVDALEHDAFGDEYCVNLLDTGGYDWAA